MPNEDGSFADWRFTETFLSERGKIRVAGVDTMPTTPMLGDYGIRECSDTLRRFGLAIPPTNSVYAGSHIRAILNMVLFSLEKNRFPSHVSVHDLIDSDVEISEIKNQIQQLKQKISDTTALALLTKWEDTNF